MIKQLQQFDKRAQKPVLLLIDNFSTYETIVELIKEGNQLLKQTRIKQFLANIISVFQLLDQGIIQNQKYYIKRQFLLFLIAEFDTRRDYTKIYYILQAIEQGIQAQESVDSTLITKYQKRGFREVNKEPENNYQAESQDLIQEIQEIASALPNSN